MGFPARPMPIRSQKTNNANLKRANVKDVSVLMRFIRDYYTFDQIPFSEEKIRHGMTALLGSPRLGIAWLILRHKRPVGYIVVTFGFDLEFGGRQATITEFYIQPEHRKNGLGRMSLGYVEKFVRRRGAQALELQVTRGNSRAYAFYLRCGFHEHHRIPMSKRLEARNIATARSRKGRKLSASGLQKDGVHPIRPSNSKSWNSSTV
jgi:GNAT superfamily N-acetyltransferase